MTKLNYILCSLLTIAVSSSAAINQSELATNTDTVEIYYLPTTTLTFAAISPEDLHKAAIFTVKIRSTYSQKIMADLLRTVENAKLSESKKDLDCRWGLIARDRNEKVVYSLYLDAGGTSMQIGMSQLSARDNSILSWFRRWTESMDQFPTR